MTSNQDKKDAQTYKDFATKGMDLMFLVKIRGKEKRPDINNVYHVTIMLFDVENDTPEQADKIARELPLNPPDPKKVTIKMSTMKGRTGYNLYNIDLYGAECKKIESLYNKFSDMGYDNNYKFQAHITVDKGLWDEFQKEDGKTAFEAGIEFLPAELRLGDKIFASYKPSRPVEWGSENPAEDKLQASENLDVGTMKEVLLMSLEIDPKHLKAMGMGEQIFKNYMEDNPALKQHLLVKHEERAYHHFNGNYELLTYALKNGIKKTYEFLRGK
jgi:hypothetical protein